MRRLISLLLAVSVLLTPALMEGRNPERRQGEKAEKGKKPESRGTPVHLLPGYKMRQSFDWEGNSSGRIWKEGGVAIEYSMGLHLEREADSIPPIQVIWQKAQTINGQKFACVYTRSNELIITITPRLIANFRAKIRNHRELAEMLLMVLSFDVEKGYPPEPGAVEILRPKPQ